MKKSITPFWWALFGAGGAITAFFVPALLFLNGLAIPLGWIEAPRYEDLLALVRHPLTRLFLFGLIFLSLFHWAHRFRYTLYDGLQLKHLNELVAVLCYGSAMVLTLFAGFTLWRI
jgi:fumarate reductase subunit D